ncbi:MAG: hypothetical protein HUU38_29880 [Anaerolineales bacterium]|nr:hypothetical protein [Anaerolineales bacterium]
MKIDLKPEPEKGSISEDEWICKVMIMEESMTYGVFAGLKFTDCIRIVMKNELFIMLVQLLD